MCTSTASVMRRPSVVPLNVSRVQQQQQQQQQQQGDHALPRVWSDHGSTGPLSPGAVSNLLLSQVY